MGRIRNTYLDLSINRWEPGRWCELDRNAGLTSEPVAGCSDPLALIEAGKS